MFRKVGLTGDDVLRIERDILNARAAVEVDDFFDLRLLFAFGRLIERHLHNSFSADTATLFMRENLLNALSSSMVQKRLNPRQFT